MLKLKLGAWEMPILVGGGGGGVGECIIYCQGEEVSICGYYEINTSF